MNKRVRSKEDVKYRQVTVTLDKEVTLKNLTDVMSRKDAMALFQELEDKGFGKFHVGSVGRSSPTKFVANENCPSTYVYNIAYYRTSKLAKESGAPVTVEQAEVKKEEVKKPVVLSLQNEGGDYALCELDGKVQLQRVNGLGFKTIESCVESVLDILQGKVYKNNSEPVSDVAEMTSILKGVGYLNYQG